MRLEIRARLEDVREVGTSPLRSAIAIEPHPAEGCLGLPFIDQGPEICDEIRLELAQKLVIPMDWIEDLERIL